MSRMDDAEPRELTALRPALRCEPVTSPRWRRSRLISTG